MPYLFQVSIGPVQTFIKGARRTRDLKFNSSFLSQLAACAAYKVLDVDSQATLIFPTPEALRMGDVSNKVLACISCDPEQLAREVKGAINEQLDTVWGEVVKRIDASFHDDLAKLQIDDLVEYVYAAVAFDPQKLEYDAARHLLEALLSARKNTRDFAPVGRWGSSEQKSSIDGALECVIPEKDYPRMPNNIEKLSPSEQERIKTAYRERAEVLRRHYDAGPHEKLSGVDLLKRRGTIREETRASSDSENEQGTIFPSSSDQRRGAGDFPSTSHMAALPFLYALNTLAGEKLQKAETWKRDYIGELKNMQSRVPFALDILPQSYRGHNYWNGIFSLDTYDGALLFPERFPDVVGDTQVFRLARADFQKATRLLEDFCREVQLYPNPYYVLLAADGDSMGSVINSQAKGAEGMQRHKNLSHALAGFSTGVREIVRKYAGVRIYSGGDDVLALLPLHEAVQCANALAQSFQTALGPFQNQEGVSPTLSVGLAVVHHLHPLGDALDIARQAEAQAKKNPGKNALAITAQKRGGPPCTIDGHWGIFDQRLEQQITLCQSAIIPSGMAYELEEIALRLEPTADHRADQAISAPHVQYAALRVFQRKLDEAKRGGRSAAEIAVTLDQLKEMIGLEPIQPVRVGRLADELGVARLFADARRLAKGKSEGEKA